MPVGFYFQEQKLSKAFLEPFSLVVGSKMFRKKISIWAQSSAKLNYRQTETGRSRSWSCSRKYAEQLVSVETTSA